MGPQRDNYQDKFSGHKVRERKDPQAVGTWKQIHKLQFKDLILINLFPADLKSERKGQHEIVASFLSEAPK